MLSTGTAVAIATDAGAVTSERKRVAWRCARDSRRSRCRAVRPPPASPSRERAAQGGERGGGDRRAVRDRRGRRAARRRGDGRRGRGGAGADGHFRVPVPAPANAGRCWSPARRGRPRGDAQGALRGPAAAHPRLRHPLEEAAAMIALLLAALTLASDPPRIQLGETTGAPAHRGASEPRVSASAGRIENLRATGKAGGRPTTCRPTTPCRSSR